MQTSTQNVKQKTCKGCRKRFRPTRATAVFCSPICSAAGTADQRAKIPRSNHFWFYLIKEAQRAGTLAVFNPLVDSVDNLMALYDLVKLRMAANIMSGKDSFHICHIAPIKHDNVLGFTSADNLMIAPATLNRRHSNKHSNAQAGVFMSRADVPLKLFVMPDEAGLLDRIIDFIGLETALSFCKEAKLKDSRRQTALTKLATLVDPSNPEHSKYIAIANDPNSKTPEVIAAVEAIQNRTEFKPMMKGGKLSDSAMLIKELIRHAGFRCELREFADIALQFTSSDFTHTTLSIDAQQTLSDLLHGVVEEEMEDEVDRLKYELCAPLRKAISAQGVSTERARLNAIEADELAERNRLASIEWNCLQSVWEAEDAGIEFCRIPDQAPVPTQAPDWLSDLAVPGIVVPIPMDPYGEVPW